MAGYTPAVARSKRKILTIVAIITGVLVVGLGAVAWAMWPEVEELPETLPDIEPEVSVADLSLDAQGPLPTLRLGDLQGKTAFLLIEGRESMTGGEGRQLHRALNRWILPEDVVGFTIGDAPAAMILMRDKIEREFLGPMREEFKLPVYVDYGGKFTEALAMPKGHLGVVILDPSGEIVLRHAGDADEDEIAEIAALLGAQEPPAPAPAPAFEVGELDNQSCVGRACVLVFLDAKVARSEIPFLEEGGFEGEASESFAQMQKPSVRLAGILARDWEADDRARIGGVVVGEGEGWELDEWAFVPEAPEARELFGIGDAAGLVVIDDQGRLAFVETGLIPIWKLSLAADVLGIEPKRHGPGKRGG